MPTKSAIVLYSDALPVEVYRIDVACPYCKHKNYIEEDFERPVEEYCFKCNKKFLIKYEKASSKKRNKK